MRSGAIRRKRDLSALITGVHIADELAEPCSSSMGVPKPAADSALRRIGRGPLMEINVAALLRRHARGLLDLLHLGGAILELGDLPERIKRRIGKQVRRRLDEGKWDEHDAVGDTVVLPRSELDHAAAR